MWVFEKSRTTNWLPLWKHCKKTLKTSIHHPLLFGEDKAGFIFGQGGVPHVLEEYEKGGNTSQTKAAILLTRTILSALVNGPFVREDVCPHGHRYTSRRKKITSHTIHGICFEQYFRCRVRISSLLCTAQKSQNCTVYRIYKTSYFYRLLPAQNKTGHAHQQQICTRFCRNRIHSNTPRRDAVHH